MGKSELLDDAESLSHEVGKMLFKLLGSVQTKIRA